MRECAGKNNRCSTFQSFASLATANLFKPSSSQRAHSLRLPLSFFLLYFTLTQSSPSKMPRSLALTSLLLLAVSSVASAANSCVAFDVQWNLLAFNFGGKDYDVGAQDTWAQGQLLVFFSRHLHDPSAGSLRHSNRHYGSRTTVRPVFSLCPSAALTNFFPGLLTAPMSLVTFRR